jgi:hypothetical protein
MVTLTPIILASLCWRTLSPIERAAVDNSASSARPDFPLTIGDCCSDKRGHIKELPEIFVYLPQVAKLLLNLALHQFHCDFSLNA